MRGLRCALALLPLLSSLAEAAEGAGTRIRVVDTRCMALPGATVVIEPLNRPDTNQPPVTCQADREGVAHCPTSSPGSYVVVASMGGFYSSRVGPLFIRGGVSLTLLLNIDWSHGGVVTEPIPPIAPNPTASPSPHPR